MSMNVAHCLIFLALSGGITLNDVSAFLWANSEESQNEVSNPASHPDINLDTPAMVRRNGYEAETHYVVTEDGCILALHRVGRGNGSKICAFYQHGLVGSSADVVITGPGKGLAYILSDAGYDVWLGNYRGNTYSQGHLTLPVTGSKYWNYSWHENGIYDLPAMISYVEKFCIKIYYIGHSMGTTSYFVMNILRPEMTKKIPLMIGFAPVAYNSGWTGPLSYFAPFANKIKSVLHIIGIDQFFPQTDALKSLAISVCSAEGLGEALCAEIVGFVGGYNKRQLNYTLLSVLFTHSPAGGSMKQYTHYAQGVMSGKFRQYDYGPDLNMKMYNSTMPPEYNLSKIDTPMMLFYSGNDRLSAESDAKELANMMGNNLDLVKVKDPLFSHFDFIFGLNAPTLVYDRALKRMRDCNKASNMYGRK